MKKFPNRVQYESKYCQMLIDHMAQGLSANSFGATIGCGANTVWSWINRHEDFNHAYNEGKAASLIFFERLMTLGSTGMEKSDKDGNTIKPNASFINFALARRFKDLYSEKQVVQHEGTTESKLVIDFGEKEEEKETE